MRILHDLSELNQDAGGSCLAIGYFDGVHKGHQRVINQTIADSHRYGSQAVVVTFDPHPATVISPGKAPSLIYPFSKKLRVIRSLGVDILLQLKFDEAFSQVTAVDFIENLKNHLGLIRSICVGERFHFGYKRQGNIERLRQIGSRLNFQVHGLASVNLAEETISSTRIRELIRSGDFDKANQMLGRSYTVVGIVVKSEGMGKQLGFPTANLETETRVLPPNGVYAVTVELDGNSHRGVANIGTRPTFNNNKTTPRIEVHLLKGSPNLYGQELEVAFLGKLRDEFGFSSVDALKAQIQKDIEQAQQLHR
ncbi:MAG TPA: bifunctional riboflavin kinase/FAD synthetase [Verrucomicrobiales bacterium]|nr:bifunctional riboflavin kinase/FAD synthetase [Verrucomicrobiales bacterium]HIL71516.1 bifunctional riboflavin kinase/FAD synthetase [Verrucomicrobiota bacterium]